ncbi:heterokaryon incompatibility protein-domain-containing protein [Paraphoma chrysanthemicola]|uniref:Heterokaryon incompatibility protein-domain-containing protein n=1 Tax=Paraphoma chrysanthemicola TaxID=798071 RepID=A0A8K0R772_9PLEO|nr:heterokaryon incompatibility protein-domain-containing protein [Paraphoma chrysanthemicola]
MAIYSPLDVKTQEIRLLELQPAEQPNQPLHGILRHVSLVSSAAQSPPLTYETISYVWGKAQFDKRIHLIGQALAITSRVEEILCRLRCKDKPRTIWIDSICIDQSNIIERSKQILLMRKIYRGGVRNIAYITPSTLLPANNPWVMQPRLRTGQSPSVQDGMKIMKKICDRENATLASFRRENEQFYGPNERAFWKHLQSEPSMTLDREAGYALSCFLDDHGDSNFWKRTWIVQEMALAKKVTLMCEDTELDWDLVSSFLRDEPYFDAFHLHEDCRHSSTIGKEYFENLFSTIKNFEDQRVKTDHALTKQSRDGDTGSDTLDVLARFRNMESTDPRDKIYGLLGLAPELHRVQINYSKSVQQVYTQTTLSIIECSRHLDIICQNPFESKFRGDEKDAEKSSWVPNFHLAERNSFSVLFAQRDIFNAGPKLLDTPCTVVGKERDILVLKGVILDRVGQCLKPSLDWSRIRHDSISVTAKLVLDLHFGTNACEKLPPRQYLPKVASGISRPDSPETMLRAYWRTLARDCVAPPNMRRLHKLEIETLDPMNTELLAHGYRLQTLRGDADKYSGRSSFRFEPREYGPHILVVGPLTDVPHGLGDYTFNVSDNGLFTMVRPHAMKGDMIVVFDGGKVPMIVREQAPPLTDDQLGTRYRIVGPAYVHGFMDGEADAAVAAGVFEKQDLLIC